MKNASPCFYRKGKNVEDFETGITDSIAFLSRSDRPSRNVRSRKISRRVGGRRSARMRSAPFGTLSLKSSTARARLTTLARVSGTTGLSTRPIQDVYSASACESRRRMLHPPPATGCSGCKCHHTLEGCCVSRERGRIDFGQKGVPPERFRTYVYISTPRDVWGRGG